mmetsp:Transcript_43492/g.51200  ORF Transcript_43492/g.51200 Transcript_43492/m.51200 type:complete len:119 (+) Transcript_43492:275-631(+)
MEKHEIEFAPTVLVFYPYKQEVDKYVNPSPDSLKDSISKQNEYYKIIMLSKIERVFQEIIVKVSSAPMVVFIKGTPTEPKCKFIRRLLAHLSKYEVSFKSYNILEDERIRQWLIVYSN